MDEISPALTNEEKARRRSSRDGKEVGIEASGIHQLPHDISKLINLIS
jgi:hypothetical protein